MESSDAADLGTDQPLNELENSLFACMAGEVSREDFLNVFVNSMIFIMVDKEPVGDTLGDSAPLVVAMAQDAPRMLAVFSAPQRAEKMLEVFGQFSYPVMVHAQWALTTLAPEMGIAFNPAAHFGFEIAPDGAKQLKDAIALAQKEQASAEK